MFLDLLKQISINTFEHEIGFDFIYAKVVSVSPIKLKLQPNVYLSEKNMIILESCKENLEVNKSVLLISFKGNFVLLGGVL